MQRGRGSQGYSFCPPLAISYWRPAPLALAARSALRCFHGAQRRLFSRFDGGTEKCLGARVAKTRPRPVPSSPPKESAERGDAGGLPAAGPGTAAAAPRAGGQRAARPPHGVRGCPKSLPSIRRSANKGICPVLVKTLRFCEHLLTETATS